MGVTPINLARVTQNLRAFNLLASVRSNQLGMFRTQNQLASGLRFNAPSDDPTRATDAIRLDRRMDILEQVRRNLQTAGATISEVEAAMQSAVDLVTQAHSLSLQAVSDGTTADERQSIRIEIESIINQLIAIGNKQHLGTYLFSGHAGDAAPFEWTAQGVLYRGDQGRLETILDSDLSEHAFTVPGMEFFDAVADGVRGFVDLDPALTLDTRLADLNGATGTGVHTGRIMVSDGQQQVTIDLAGADTVGDVIDKLNAEMPESLVATIDGQAIIIRSADATPREITVVDVAGGTAAVELGIQTDSPTSNLRGADLDPRLTGRTKLETLNGGAGIDLAGGLTIRVGNEVAVVSFEKTATIEDVINRINQTGIGVWARIADDGKTIEVRNRVSGAPLRIEENGGQAATALGIRSLYGGTRLGELNDGRGVQTVDGDDFRITTADGTQIDIDLDDIDVATSTIQDVIDLINAQAGGAVTASLTPRGNGIRIQDNTAGPGLLTISRLNLSPAIDGLGLDVDPQAGFVDGRDANPVSVTGPFTPLLELRRALDEDDTQAIMRAGQWLESALQRMQQVQGQTGARAAELLRRSERIENEIAATRVLQSDVRDVDLTEAIVRYQQMQTALQANLATASKIMNLSLLDYLR